MDSVTEKMSEPINRNTESQRLKAKLKALLAGRAQFQEEWAKATDLEQLLAASERLKFVEDKPSAWTQAHP